jgi:peptidylprolyl isomerase
MRRFRHARSTLIVACCLPVLILAAACGSDDSSDSAGDVAPATTSLDAVTVTGAFGEAPKVDFSLPFATTETNRKLISEGDGEVLAEGSTAVIDYAMVNGRDGKEFETSFGSVPTSVTLDQARMIPGVVKGLLGIKVGSRALVALSPDDAFKSAGGVQEAGVQADDTVLLVVDVKEVRHPLARATGTAVAPVAGQPTVALDADGKPTITVPEGAAPTTLVAQPLIQGTGPVVAAGQTIVVHYTGVIWPGGKQFDSSWDSGETASFTVGAGRVIPGWDEGLVGQTVGSQVLLVVPPDKGYGSAGQADAGITGTDTLVFVVDMLDAF